ncbi:WD40 repeat protein [Coemansia sp. RSA 2681]|nr:WD40 repeat protein [Coemansia sp. RSA 2681]
MAMVATRSHVFRLTWAGVVVSTTLVCDIHDSPLHTGGLQHSDPITHDSPLHTGELQHNPSDSIVHDSPPAAQVRQMLRVPVRGAAVWAELFLFSDGTVRVLSGDGSAHMLPGAAFTVLAYSAASGVVAAGTAGSEVLLYALGGGEGPAPALLAQWTLGHDRTARVTALAWAPDGAALACGYSTGHVVLRTALGLELNATRLGSSAKQAAAAAAVAQPRLLHWAPGATRLYVLSDCVAAGGARCGQQGDVLPLARAAGGEGGARRVCLYADDKVLLHHGDFYGQQQQQRGDPGADLPPPELLWHVAHVPPAYIGANWPLRHVAADADGQHVAVAGRRGVACYSVAAQRWRLLRNRQQEAALACEGGLLWHREHLVVACANHACGGAPQLLFFARARPLDTAGDVQAVALAAPAVAMSCHDSELLVLCRNNVVYQYALFDALGVVQVSLRRAASLAQAGVDARRVRSLQWVPSALFDARPAFLVHEGIELKVVSVGAKEGQPPSVAVVSGRVEFTITSGVNFGNMHSTVWWFSGSHLYAALISLEDFMEGGVGALVDSMEGGARHSHRHRHRRHVLRIRPEFFPVAISADRGMAVGIDQDWTLEEHAVIGLAKLPVRAKLYLHNILDHMLSDGAEQDALMYAACFEHLEFFPHAMEILLHEVLEREMDHFHLHRQRQLAVSDDATESDDAVVSDGAAAAAAAAVISDDAAVLPRVVALLENFSAFHEIVVHCARKTEAAFWSHLFACVGGPEKFFRQCLNNNELETATQSLIILQTLEPASVNEDNILALLAKVVAAQNKDLCLEILRFVKMTSESDPTMKRLLTRLHKS